MEESTEAPKHRKALAFGLLGATTLLVLLIFTAGASAQRTPGELPASRSLETLLVEPSISRLEPGRIQELASFLPAQALDGSRSPEAYAASFFPNPAEILAMLARDRDVDDFMENADAQGAAGIYYQNVVDLVPSMKPLRLHYEAFFKGVARGLDALGREKRPESGAAGSYSASAWEGGVTLPRLSSRPRRSQFDYSHTFALDIFLKDVETNAITGLERGPYIFSLEAGLVVASDSSWKGGFELSEYRSGGITPKAGNGVIVYAPDSRRFYLYFHLYDTSVGAGDLIPAGYPLGRGGNTGTNARKPGHGEHLHLEIFDMESGRFLRNTEILKIAFD
ncbi:MAG TPA: M23 family metallopeptidase [Rectinemataceae bacterium]